MSTQSVIRIGKLADILQTTVGRLETIFHRHNFYITKINVRRYVSKQSSKCVAVEYFQADNTILDTIDNTF